LQAPRSLWDSTYTETSWITQYSTYGPINLLPRLQSKIADNYAGTKLSITEYNYGGGSHISGGIAQADVLGIFGRDGVFAANQWPLAANETYVAGAFQMYRNFDGQGGTFGDTTILANTSNVADSSVYASIDSTNPNVMVVVAINKTGSSLPATLNISNVAAGATAKAYQLTNASASPQFAGEYTIANPGNFAYTMPAYSVSTIRIALTADENGAPTVATPAAATPGSVIGTTTNLTVLGADAGGEANLQYTWSVTARPNGAANPTFSANGSNAAKNVTATFARAGSYTFLVTISDGTLTTTSSVTVLVNPTATSILLTPATATVGTSASTQFAAVVRDQFGVNLSNQPAVAWSVLSGAGTISSSGRYTAPATTGSAMIRASSGSLSATAEIAIINTTPPLRPKIKAPQATSTSAINVRWKDRSKNELGFLIEMSLDGKTFSQIGAVGADVLHFSVTGLSTYTKYFFRVRSFNEAGESVYSKIAAVRTKRR